MWMSRHSTAIDARRLDWFFRVLNGSIGSLVGPNDTIDKGLQNNQIASAPEISYDGVSYHLNQIRERLGVGARRSANSAACSRWSWPKAPGQKNRRNRLTARWHLSFLFRLDQRAVGAGPADLRQVIPTGAAHAMRIQSLVAPGLKFKQVGVLSVHGEQAFVGPLFQDFTLVDDNDLISRAHG